MLFRYVEIYNEKIRDLLNPDSTDLKVRQHKSKGVFIQGATSVYAGSPEEVNEFFVQGQENRVVGCNFCLSSSDRSELHNCSFGKRMPLPVMFLKRISFFFSQPGSVWSFIC